MEVADENDIKRGASKTDLSNPDLGSLPAVKEHEGSAHTN